MLFTLCKKDGTVSYGVSVLLVKCIKNTIKRKEAWLHFAQQNAPMDLGSMRSSDDCAVGTMHTFCVHFVNKMFQNGSRRCCCAFCITKCCVFCTSHVFFAWNILLCKMYQNVMQKYIFASKMFTSKNEFLQVLRKDLQKTIAMQNAKPYLRLYCHRKLKNSVLA